MRRLVCLTSVVVLPVGLLHAILSLNAAMASSSSAQWRSRPTELLDQARDLTLSLYGSAGSPAEGWFPEQVESTTKQSSSDMGGGTDALPTWMNRSNLVFNPEAKALLTQWVPTKPGRVTLHFTFGSVVMMDFVKNGCILSVELVSSDADRCGGRITTRALLCGASCCHGSAARSWTCGRMPSGSHSSSSSSRSSTSRATGSTTDTTSRPFLRWALSRLPSCGSSSPPATTS